MVINMTQNNDGLWSYDDPVQADMAFQLEAISGLDLTSYDVWLNDDAVWAGHEKTRTGLIALRHELTHAYSQHFSDNSMLEVWCERYFQSTQNARMHMAGKAIATKDLARIEQARSASEQPRPNAKSEFREKISTAMGPYKREGRNFKDFMQMWQHNITSGLTAKTNDHRQTFVITDDEGDLGETTYTWGSLKVMYSQCKSS